MKAESTQALNDDDILKTKKLTMGSCWQMELIKDLVQVCLYRRMMEKPTESSTTQYHLT